MLDTLGALPATCDEGVVYAHLADLQVDGVDSLRREVKLRFMECLLIRALRFAHRLAGTDSPEDLAQDVGSRLLNRYETKPVTAVILWRSAYVAVFRGWVRRNERRLPEILSGLDVGADLASNESVEQRVEQREELRRVLNVIRSFPPRERENLIRVLHRSTDAGDILQDDSSGLQSRDAEKRALTRARNRLREQTRLATDDAGDRHEKGQDEESETEEEDK
jgi:DNA-directed RNA polymerase specialized sigma24 family protein